jgi:hypothetical protein
MNTHCSEDELLQFGLGVLDGRAELRVRTHVGSCSQCAALLTAVERSLAVLGECNPVISMDVPDLTVARNRAFGSGVVCGPEWQGNREGSKPREAGRMAMVRFAAVLCLGIGIGFAASDFTRQSEPTVVRQQIVPRPTTPRAGEFTSCRVDELQAR